MKNSPTISVIMSVYNTDKKWLRESIESILNQTFSDFEFLIILDCPTDDSEQVVIEYAKADSRVIILKNDVNIGLTKSLNQGLKTAKGKYIARMDADDVSVLTRFEREYAYLEAHPEVVAVGSRCFLPVSQKPVMNDWTEDQEVLAIRMLFSNVGLPHPSAMIRRAVLAENNIRYTESIKKSQDYKLWVDLLPYGKLILLPDILLIYREHEKQISADKSSQYSYANRITIDKAKELMGDLSAEETELHLSVFDVDSIDDNQRALNKYLRKIASANRERKLYHQQKLERELDYLWCRKAMRRMILKHKADMMLSPRTLRMLKPDMLRYIKENKQRTKQYIMAIDEFKQKVQVDF